MTRLIDADALVACLQNDPLFDLVECYGLTSVIEAQPTVYAVPVEYILKQIVRLERSKGQSYPAICYRNLLEAWEMRNERKEK